MEPCYFTRCFLLDSHHFQWIYFSYSHLFPFFLVFNMHWPSIQMAHQQTFYYTASEFGDILSNGGRYFTPLPSWWDTFKNGILDFVERKPWKSSIDFSLTLFFSSVLCLLCGGDKDIRKIIFLICFSSFKSPLLIVINTISLEWNRVNRCTLRIIQKSVSPPAASSDIVFNFALLYF